ncbi:hypothetical protein H0H81_011374 [Sphagnurus paluster]|uniref:BTB domain-containing protein n=1 Tax=Sphagnurus paluster TaxID=117069 RepID=A0A9P7K2C7_9AGAR|nr:hypothetical protein H0H81_011374 [Sphagnurus paluster]
MHLARFRDELDIHFALESSLSAMAPSQNEPLMESPEFWFSDGSIVIIVENTAFRLHKSILGKHSDVFADLFSVPQPQSDLELIDGVPVVHLQDNLQDFTDVLRALYEPFHFDKLTPEADLATLIQFLSGILRISTKYNIITLREKCIMVLRTKFPSSLSACDRLLSSGYKYVASTIVRAIPLARATNVPEILPWAFYISTNIAHDALLDDGVLSWHDKALCLAGKNQLWEMQKSVTHKFMFEFSRAPTCALCRIPPSMAMTWQRAEELRGSPHPLMHFDGWDSLQLCVRCLDHVKTQYQKGREKVWKALPIMFRLGSWEEIHQEQNR